jgi:hypothetical protein
MNGKVPGFSASVTVARLNRQYCDRHDAQITRNRLVVPQRDEFLCGLGLAAALFGALTLNPGAAVGGLGAALAQC